MKRRAIVGGAALVGVFTAITIGGTQVETPESPVADGWPDASNTGVPDGVTLTPYTGPLTITASGVTNIVGKEIGTSTSPVQLTIAESAGTVNITDSRVWGNVYITCGGDSLGTGEDVTHCPASTPYLNMTDSEVQQGNTIAIDGGVEHENFHLLRVEINGGRRSFNCETDAIIEDSWLHGIVDDPSGVAHQSTGRMSQGCTLIGNTFECTANDYPPDAGCSADLTGYGDFETVADNLIQGNYFKATTGGTCAYGGSSAGKPYPDAHNIRFIDNVFGRREDTNKCGFYFSIIGFNPNAPGNVWSNNTWADTGLPVPSDG